MAAKLCRALRPEVVGAAPEGETPADGAAAAALDVSSGDVASADLTSGDAASGNVASAGEASGRAAVAHGVAADACRAPRDRGREEFGVTASAPPRPSRSTERGPPPAADRPVATAAGRRRRGR